MLTILYMIFNIIGNKIYRDIKHQTPLFMLLVYPCYPVSDIKILFSRTKMSLTTAKADTKSFFLNCNFVCVYCISISCLHWLVFFCIFVNFVKHLLTSTTKRKWERLLYYIRVNRRSNHCSWRSDHFSFLTSMSSLILAL